MKMREYAFPWELDLDGDGYVFCDEYHAMSEQRGGYEMHGHGANRPQVAAKSNRSPRQDARRQIESSPESNGWTSYSLSHVGKVRQRNADAYLDRPDLGLWAVADGMGKHAAGDLASECIVAALDEITPQETLDAFVHTVEASLRTVNRALSATGAARHAAIGSTVVALLAHGRYCAYLWAGDSRAYLYRDGTLTQLTTDHTMAELCVKQGLLTPEEAPTNPAAKILTDAVGVSEELCTEGDLLVMQPGDRFLLCSDGLHKHVLHEELASVLGQGSTSNVARTLVDETLSRGATDNVTVVVVDIQRRP